MHSRVSENFSDCRLTFKHIRTNFLRPIKRSGNSGKCILFTPASGLENPATAIAVQSAPPAPPAPAAATFNSPLKKVAVERDRVLLMFGGFSCARASTIARQWRNLRRSKVSLSFCVVYVGCVSISLL
ncbi:hypothetical protein TcasGA2_TC034866 [Tribolium castaneum]|uniref:Uncharacterized protein n=1 Tax=Tribolium castaneum TaxID=7070 RepID=A0A139WCF4_TRICA|nr:hypothetical protein TcasGA2_TC034866 [Tribolium castaneum]